MRNYDIEGRGKCEAEEIISLARCYPEWQDRLKGARMGL